MENGKAPQAQALNKAESESRAAKPMLRQMMLVFLCVISSAVIAINGWSLWSSWQRTLHLTEENARNLSVSLSRQAEDTFLQIDLTLQDVRDRINQNGIEQQADNLHQLLMARKAALSPLDSMVIYHASGYPAISSSSAPLIATSVADREYFRFHQRSEDNQLHIGDVIRSRVSGNMVIPVSQRLSRPDGSFLGVVMASIRLDYFRQVYDYYNLGDRDLMALMKADAKLVYIRPYSESLINRSISLSPLFTQLLTTSASGAAIYRAAVDGRPRIFGYASLRSYPLVVTAGYDLQEVRQAWFADSIGFVLLNLVLLALLFLLGFIVLHHIRLNLRNQLELTRVHDQLTHMNRTLQGLALMDGLTGLANRRQLDWFMPRAMERAIKLRTPLTILLIDVDSFKPYNDTYGHLAGDECLRNVAECLKRLPLRHEDLIARYGGEEFMVVLADKTQPEAQLIARQAVQAVAALRMPHETSSVAEKVVTISVGMHWQPRVTAGTAPTAFIDKADAALYQAKHQGKNQVWLSDQAPATE
ncbi:diguanylate cyclase (GGDEF)-like protein [Pantoea alhagi]|uniref:sensor domain-containing diguanylate cyclase n=1 Tax=Mixta sp. BE291 TaxID=3158787 RepID=UPI00285EE502|nr:diguanylate cyclase (GGDEF)-like protein [Pantoea alhagi]